MITFTGLGLAPAGGFARDGGTLIEAPETPYGTPPGGFRPPSGLRPPAPQIPVKCPPGFVKSRGACTPKTRPPVPGKPVMFQCPGGGYVAPGSACPHGGFIDPNGTFVSPQVPQSYPPTTAPPVGPGPKNNAIERWRACQTTPSEPACINFMGEVAKMRSMCANPAGAGHRDCVEFQAFLAAIGEGQPGPMPGPMPGPTPMEPPPGMSPGVKKGLIAVGVLGVGLAIAAAVFAPG
jgi:hypothetical protein